MMAAEIHPVDVDEDGGGQCEIRPDPNDDLADKVKSPLRKRCVNFVETKLDTFILAAIFLNSIAIACVDYRYIDDNYQPSAELSVRNNIIEILEAIFTCIFTMECMLKIFAYGFVRGKHSYLRDGWNILDFVIVFVR